MALILDHSSPLGKLVKTSAGGARVPATLMRPGLSTYFVGGKPVVHYTPRSVVLDAAASAKDCPVTFKHPKEREVNTSNADRETRGHVSGVPTVNDEGILVGELVINSGQLLDAIDTGVAREISPGYDILVIYEPGVTDEGEHYDVLRTKATFNHFAVLPAGRQGRKVRCLLDSAGESILEDTHMLITIDGAEVSADAVQGRIDGLVEGNKGLKAQVESLTLKLTDATDPAKFEAAVNDAAEKLVVKRAEEKRVADEAAAAEKLASERLAKAKAKFPTMILDGKSSEYIEGLLANDADGVVAMAGGLQGTAAPVPGVTVVVPVIDSKEEVLDAREYQRRQNAALWTQPIPGALTAKGVVASVSTEE